MTNINHLIQHPNNLYCAKFSKIKWCWSDHTKQRIQVTSRNITNYPLCNSTRTCYYLSQPSPSVSAYLFLLVKTFVNFCSVHTVKYWTLIYHIYKTHYVIWCYKCHKQEREFGQRVARPKFRNVSLCITEYNTG